MRYVIVHYSNGRKTWIKDIYGPFETEVAAKAEAKKFDHWSVEPLKATNPKI